MVFVVVVVDRKEMNNAVTVQNFTQLTYEKSSCKLDETRRRCKWLTVCVSIRWNYIFFVNSLRKCHKIDSLFSLSKKKISIRKQRAKVETWCVGVLFAFHDKMPHIMSYKVLENIMHTHVSILHYMWFSYKATTPFSFR